MAGALTANAVDGRLHDEIGNPDPVAIADVSMLSPVDGANNVLLTGVVIVTEIDTEGELTFQWYRVGLGIDPDDDVLGDPVGDPFVIDTGDSELDTGPIVIQAIDRGAGLTSAYGLAISDAVGNDAAGTAVYVDAVLYD